MIDIQKAKKVAQKSAEERQQQKKNAETCFVNACYKCFEGFDLEKKIDRTIEALAAQGHFSFSISVHLTDQPCDAILIKIDGKECARIDIDYLSQMYITLLGQPILGMNSKNYANKKVMRQADWYVRNEILYQYRKEGYDLYEDEDNYLSDYLYLYRLSW